jgi:hypothetical protein
VNLGDYEAAALWRSKATHFSLFVVFQLTAVLLAGSGVEEAFSAITLPRLAFVFGALVDAYVPGGSATGMCKRFAKSMVACVLGFIMWVVLVASDYGESGI